MAVSSGGHELTRISLGYSWALGLLGTEGMNEEEGGEEMKGSNGGRQKWESRESSQEVLIKLQQTLRVSELRGNPMC